MDFDKDYHLAVDDEDYPQGFSDAPEDDEEYDDVNDYGDYDDYEEEDGPFYDPQDGRY